MADASLAKSDDGSSTSSACSMLTPRYDATREQSSPLTLSLSLPPSPMSISTPSTSPASGRDVAWNKLLVALAARQTCLDDIKGCSMQYFRRYLDTLEQFDPLERLLVETKFAPYSADARNGGQAAKQRGRSKEEWAAAVERALIERGKKRHVFLRVALLQYAVLQDEDREQKVTFQIAAILSTRSSRIVARGNVNGVACVLKLGEPDDVDIANEVRIISALEGLPGVPKLLFHGQCVAPTAGYGFVMTPVGATSLHEAVQTADVDTVTMWVDSLVSVLKGIHSRRVVHCDLKPSNIIIDATGQPVIIDFGSSRFVGDRLDDVATTEKYQSERFLSAISAGGRADVKYDVEALCFSLWFLLEHVRGHHHAAAAESPPDLQRLFADEPLVKRVWTRYFRKRKHSD